MNRKNKRSAKSKSALGRLAERFKSLVGLQGADLNDSDNVSPLPSEEAGPSRVPQNPGPSKMASHQGQSNVPMDLEPEVGVQLQSKPKHSAISSEINSPKHKRPGNKN